VPGRERLFAALVVGVALLFSLAIGEVALRSLTPFPIGYESNKLADPDLGYRLSTDFPEADADGFRNVAGTGHRVMAIGDSHTYGNNVAPEDSWPAVLSRESGQPVYNFGIGSQGILAYHAVLQTRRTPETRAAILALYPGNDFAAVSSNCLVLRNPSPFWQGEIARLQLDWPRPVKNCADAANQKPLSAGEWLVTHSAIVGASSAVFECQGLPADAAKYTFPDGVLPLLVERVDQHSDSTSPDDPVVADLLRDFRRLAEDWARQANAGGVSVGVMIVPSRERVIYGYFDRNGRLGELAPQFAAQLQNQLALEARAAETLAAAGVPYRFALDEVVTAFGNALHEGRSLYLANDDGHPLEDGYAAYARVARQLLDQIAPAAP